MRDGIIITTKKMALATDTWRQSKYAFLQYIEVTHSIDVVGDLLGSVPLKWKANDEVDHNL